MGELVKKSTEDIKDKLYDCLQYTFEEIEAVKHHLSCIYEGVANDLDILNANNEHYSEVEEVDGYGYVCTNKTCNERIRNKAIDEFRSAILQKFTEEERNGNYRFYSCELKQGIADLAEQLKGGAV